MFNNNKVLNKLMWWPFRKRSDELEELKKAIQLSFSNVKKDMESFKGDHHSKISEVLDRLTRLEKGLQTWSQNESFSLPNPNKAIDLFDHLTDKQKFYCQVLASLHKESPNKWISQKIVASELYPDKEYNKIRTMVTQYLAHLEEIGYVKKKMKGNFSYVMSTELNPYLNLDQQKVKELKKQGKKSKQS